MTHNYNKLVLVALFERLKMFQGDRILSRRGSECVDKRRNQNATMLDISGSRSFEEYPRAILCIESIVESSGYVRCNV